MTHISPFAFGRNSRRELPHVASRLGSIDLSRSICDTHIHRYAYIYRATNRLSVTDTTVRATGSLTCRTLAKDNGPIPVFSRVVKRRETVLYTANLYTARASALFSSLIYLCRNGTADVFKEKYIPPLLVVTIPRIIYVAQIRTWLRRKQNNSRYYRDRRRRKYLRTIKNKSYFNNFSFTCTDHEKKRPFRFSAGNRRDEKHAVSFFFFFSSYPTSKGLI